jgi:hypothetical protein
VKIAHANELPIEDMEPAMRGGTYKRRVALRREANKAEGAKTIVLRGMSSVTLMSKQLPMFVQHQAAE